MGTILRFKNFKFIIRTNDHSPAHVHVVYGKDSVEKECKITLVDSFVVSSFGFTEKELRMFLSVIESKKEIFLAQWEAIHEKK